MVGTGFREKCDRIILKNFKNGKNSIRTFQKLQVSIDFLLRFPEIR